MSSWDMLSSMMMSAPASTASRTMSSVSHSTSTLSTKGADARAHSMARATPPAASMWLSLSSTPSDRPKRCIEPPPRRTASRSNRRMPGVVLRVQTRRVPVPASPASTLAV